MFEIVLNENDFLSGKKGGGYRAPSRDCKITIVDIALPRALPAA